MTLQHPRCSSAPRILTGLRRNWRLAVLVAYALVMQTFVASATPRVLQLGVQMLCNGNPAVASSLATKLDPAGEALVDECCVGCWATSRLDGFAPLVSTVAPPAAQPAMLRLAAEIDFAAQRLLRSWSARGPPVAPRA